MSPWPGPQPQHGAGRSSRHPRCRRQGLSDHGLEGVQVGVRHGIDLPLSDAPPEIIQRIEVWGRGWPEVGGPELSEGGVEEVLHLGGCVGWSPVLLEDIVAPWVGAPQPWQNLVPEDLVVDIGIAFLVLAEEHGGHPLSVAGQNAQHHHLLWVLLVQINSTSSLFTASQRSLWRLWNWSTVKIFLSEKILTVDTALEDFIHDRSFLALASLLSLADSVMSCTFLRTKDLKPSSATACWIVSKDTSSSLACWRRDTLGLLVILVSRSSRKALVDTQQVVPDPAFLLVPLPALLASATCSMVLMLTPATLATSLWGKFASRRADTLILLVSCSAISWPIWTFDATNDSSLLLLSSKKLSTIQRCHMHA